MEKSQKKQLIADVICIVLFTAVVAMNLKLKNVNAMVIIGLLIAVAVIGLLTYKVAEKHIKESGMDNAYLILRNTASLCLLVIMLLEYIG